MSNGLIIFINIRSRKFTFLKYHIIHLLFLLLRAMNDEAVPWSGSFVLVTCTFVAIMTPAKKGQSTFHFVVTGQPQLLGQRENEFSGMGKFVSRILNSRFPCL